MGRFVAVELDTSRIELIIATVPQKAHTLLDKAAFRVQARAQAEARVDTGAMKSSAYTHGTSGGKGETYADAASGLNTDQVAPAVQATNPFERVIAFAVNYALFHEFGTRFMSAKPMLIPAIEEARSNLVRKWSDLLK